MPWTITVDLDSCLSEYDHQITSILVAIMPAITIKNLPDGLYEQIKVNVKAHHRSINGELIAILERVLNAHRPDPAEELARIRGLRASLDLPTLDPRKIRAAVESERATDSV